MAELGRVWLDGSADLGYIHTYVCNLLGLVDSDWVDLCHTFIFLPLDQWIFLKVWVEVREGKPNHKCFQTPAYIILINISLLNASHMAEASIDKWGLLFAYTEIPL